MHCLAQRANASDIFGDLSKISFFGIILTKCFGIKSRECERGFTPFKTDLMHINEGEREEEKKSVDG